MPRSRLLVWFLAARPKTLLASFAPVTIGSALAARDGRFHAPAMLAALLGALTIQIGTNFCNDYCDYFQGADTESRKGPTRAVQAGWISPRDMLLATILMFTISLGFAGYLASRGGGGLLVIGGLGVLSGIMYTAGRHSLAYLGLADPFVLVFFGPIAVGGTYYVQSLALPVHVVIAGLAPGLLAVGLLVVNNLRDVGEDRLAGKRTLAVRWGIGFGRVEYLICILGSFVIPLLLWSQYDYPVTCVLIGLIVFLLGMRIVRQVWSGEGAALGPCLGMTAGLLLLYAVLFSASVVWQ